MTHLASKSSLFILLWIPDFNTAWHTNLKFIMKYKCFVLSPTQQQCLILKSWFNRRDLCVHIGVLISQKNKRKISLYTIIADISPRSHENVTNNQWLLFVVCIRTRAVSARSISTHTACHTVQIFISLSALFSLSQKRITEKKNTGYRHT